MGILVRIASVIRRYQQFRLGKQSGTIGAFYREGGNRLLYEHLPVNTDDVVIDGGGFEGTWTDELLCRYGCRVIIFEPVRQFAESLRQRYAANQRVRVIPQGLSRDEKECAIHIAGSGSSLFRDSLNTSTEMIQLCNFGAFLRQKELNDIACLKLNIEGGEYDVLEQLIQEELINVCRSILVQFHQIHTDSENRRHTIQKTLTRTHACRFDYPFVWEYWVKPGIHENHG